MRSAHIGVPGAAIASAMAALSLAACSPAPGKVAAPKVEVAKIEDLPTPLPKPYDDTKTSAEVSADIDAAFAAARRDDKRVIIDLGGDWCVWCRTLAAVMDLPQVRPFLADNFEIVPVAVSSKQGSTDQNLQVLSRFGVKKVGGVPWLIVAEPDGKVLNSSYEVTDDDHHTPQAMVDWLAQWARRAPGESMKAKV